MANGTGYTPSGNHLGVNLAFTKFLFVVPRREDETGMGRIKSAGASIARGFFNDFDADGTRDAKPHETVHFYVAQG
ncbi:MAG: hypothetical protein AB7K63_19920, partial [Vicinamibacterales bacterium]